MSVTFHVEGWSEVPMVDMPIYIKDEFPGLDRSDFVAPDGTPEFGYHVNNNGDVYRIEKVAANDVVWPDVNRCNGNAAMDIRQMMDNPDQEDFYCGSITEDQVKNLPFDRTPPVLMGLIEFARSRGKGIYWV